jgi:phosphatidylserine/phosphatidylglycerophosphate/cardiolipin synthase-like enzyme
MVSPGALGHNKFVVICAEKSSGPVPLRVLSGSTNWTKTGLCTQVNNGIVIDNADVAAAYFAHWQRLKAAGNDKPKTLAKNNPSPVGPFGIGGTSTSVWLTPVKQQIDIEALKEIVNDAKEGILFVMFNPGGEPLHSILERQKQGFYVRGVVNQIGKAEREEVRVIKATKPKKFFLDVIEPQGVAKPLATWAAEVTRKQFLSDIGFAMTHAKVLVIDPFGTRPVVVTGSHNFSKSASEKNDDNFVVVEGHKKLAEAYAVNCMMTYRHYRWREYLQEAARRKEKPFSHLIESPNWQRRLTDDGQKADFDFWL